MGIIDTSVKKPITISMVLIAVFILGFISLSGLAIDLFPDIEFPSVMVSTDYDGIGPEQVEQSVTRLVEGACKSVSGIDTLTSTSSEGNSLVVAQFDWGSDTDEMADKIKDNLDMYGAALPDDASDPIIFKFSMDMKPIMRIAVTGSSDLSYLYEICDEEIADKLEQVPGVGSVSLNGGNQKYILVEFTKNRLDAYGLDISTVALKLATENQNVSGGELYSGIYRYSIRSIGQFEDLTDIENMVVTSLDGVTIQLKDIATVDYAYDEDSSIVKVNGEPGMYISVTKESGKNTVQTAEGIIEKIAEINEDYATKGVQLEVFSNDAEDIMSSISGVSSSALFGALFAVIIVMFFLWDLRSMFIIGISIPASIIVTFVLMYFMDVTLNIMSLAGLSLGVGMMVDASIVVLENIFYHRERGMGRYSASIKGAKEVVLAITASTLTTIAVFAPIAFAGGFVAEIFTDMALTVVFSLSASLMVAIAVIPMLTSQIKSLEKPAWMKKGEAGTNKVLGAVDRFYGKILDHTLKHKKLVLLLSMVGVVVVIVVSMMFLGSEFFPTTDEGQFDINIELPVGTRVEVTEEITYALEADVLEICGDDLDRISSTVQSGARFGFLGANSSHKASIRGVLVAANERDRSVDDVMEEIRIAGENYPAEIKVDAGGASTGMMGGSSLTIQIFGEDLDTDEDLANQVIALLEEIEGVREADISREDPLPEVQLSINRELASQVGLSFSTVSSAVKSAFGGTTASYLRQDDGTEYDIVMKYAEEDRLSLEDLETMSILSVTGQQIPLSSVVDIEMGESPSEIDREDSRRLLTVTAKIYGSDMGTVVAAAQKSIDDNIFVPKGYEIIFSGDYEDMQDSFKDLALVFILAVVLVYAIMASQFESLIAPFVIMFAVPFGAAGSFLSLLITGTTMSVVSIAGVVVLVGIVINNGIVLIDHINQLLYENREMTNEQAAKESGIRRFRPITMTTITTLLGWLPMALGLGQGSEMYSPLAISMLGGLLISYLFTLVIVPTLYAGIRNRSPLKFHEDSDMAKEGIEKA